MKNVILTVIAVFAISIANGQVREKGAIEITPQIGYSSANYFGKDVGGANDPIVDATFGVAGDYFFNNRWSLHSGLLFQTMGTKVGSLKEELKYLTIPVNANWHFGSTRKWYLNFGPSVGFIMSAKSDGVDVKEFTNSTQIGFNTGIGYKIAVSEKFSISIDYQSVYGLNDVAKDSEYSFRNNFGSFNVGGVIKL
ncbi:outer membrane beta-barrel protein [Flavobacterium sp.]